MLKEMSYVKNPLTVIAIFAGIAETSGAVILPSLDKGIQGTFVWFLMLFPCLLIALFFFVLYKKHHVLYAPSDYKEDKSFIDLHFTTTGGFKELGREKSPIEVLPMEAVEVVEAPEEPEGEPVGPNPHAGGVVDEPATDESVNITLPNEKKSNSDVDATSFSRILPGIGGVLDSGLSFLARQKILNGLAQKLGGAVEINVQSKQYPNIRFDAVIDSGATKSVVEFVSVVPDISEMKNSVQVSLRMAQLFWDSLSEQEKGQFVFHLALMHRRGSHPMRVVPLAEIVELSVAMPFKTIATLYEYDVQNITSYDLHT